jgi:GT2 family glycosyltransferase
MIPVLGIPVISRPDLLRECVASIDEPIGRLVIVDNSPGGGMADGLEPPDCVSETLVTRPPDNLGYSGSLNFVIKTHAWAPWWAYLNVDAVCAPRDLSRVAERMDAAIGPLLCGIRDFRLFGLNAAMVETIGFWDENFWPIYCEDSDYSYRIAVTEGAERIVLQGDTGHFGSVTIVDPVFSEHNARTYPTNRDYYRRKWGGDIAREVYTTPFDRGGSVADWTLDLRRVRDNRWQDAPA